MNLEVMTRWLEHSEVKKCQVGLDGDVVDRTSTVQHHWETALGTEQEAGAGSRTFLEEALDKEFHICLYICINKTPIH